MAGTRPGGVTLVAVLAWISGALQIISGILVLVGVGGATTAGGAGTTAAWISIVIGILTIAVSLGLLRGNNVARILTAIIFVLNLASAIFLIVSFGVSFTAILGGALALIGLLILFSPRANEFFRR